MGCQFNHNISSYCRSKYLNQSRRMSSLFDGYGTEYAESDDARIYEYALKWKINDNLYRLRNKTIGCYFKKNKLYI